MKFGRVKKRLEPTVQQIIEFFLFMKSQWWMPTKICLSFRLKVLVLPNLVFTYIKKYFDIKQYRYLECASRSATLIWTKIIYRNQNGSDIIFSEDFGDYADLLDSGGEEEDEGYAKQGHTLAAAGTSTRLDTNTQFRLSGLLLAGSGFFAGSGSNKKVSAFNYFY